MKITDLAEICGFEKLNDVSDAQEVEGAYCCDLLSWVIGRAGERDALITVMTNQNVVAVAVMADLPCIILTEGVHPEARVIEKATENKIPVLRSQNTTYETAVKVHEALQGATK